MKKSFILLVLFSVFILSGCTSSSVIDSKIIENRDNLRLSNAQIINTIIQLYAVDTEKLPTFKDNNGNFKTLKLFKNSDDFNQLSELIRKNDSSQSITIDPSDPERSFEYYSDGSKYVITVYFENSGKENCQLIKVGYCKYEITGNLIQTLK